MSYQKRLLDARNAYIDAILIRGDAEHRARVYGREKDVKEYETACRLFEKVRDELRDLMLGKQRLSA